MTQYPLFRLLFAPVALLLGVAACSSERKSLVGHAYENVVARDNGFFLAREKLRATEETLYKARVNDYNRVLPLFPTLDDATVGRVTADLDDIIKKASLPIQHRPGSDWTDDSYLVIGKARFYKKEYEDAGKTFKYVNTTTKDPNAKHEALIWLMRTFLALKEYDNAAAVSDILDKEQGVEQNARELFLTRAEYFLLTGDQKQAIVNLEKAIPYISPKNEQSRTRYILAQLYQAGGQDKEAYAQLNKILKKNPPYELDFFSKLMLGQVSDLNATDRARLDKYFAKLLKDTKNKEYTDKIYYEMARLEYRQQQYDKALTLLRKAARANGSNRAQKSYTYLLAGRIYYENLQKYRLAAAYYDSTVQNMDRAAPEYAATAERSDILKEFAKQITTIETQDSLQTLARLDSAALRTQLLTFATAEVTARKKEADRIAAQQELTARQEQQAASGVNSLRPGESTVDPLALANGVGGALFYFDNPTALSTAKAEFVRRWGDRQLQDNWRTSSQVSSSPATVQGGNVPLSIAGGSSTRVNPAGDATLPAAVDPEAQARQLAATYRQNLPLTEAQMQASQKLVEEALFALGAIYSQQLKEPTRAAETYEKLVTRFPQSKHNPEVFYSLYLLYKELNDPKAEAYAQRLRQEYPNSSYARLVADPEYLRRTSIANEQVAVQLDSAFAFYKKQEFKKATAVLARTKKQNPVSDLNDRVDYLSTLLVIRTQPPAAAKVAVEKFSKTYPESPLSGQARELLASYKRYEEGQIAGALASTDKPVVSMFRPGEVDNRMRIYYDEVSAAPKTVPAPALPLPTVPAPATDPASKATPAPAATPPAPETKAPVTKKEPVSKKAPAKKGAPATAPAPATTTLAEPVTTTPSPTPTAPATPAPEPVKPATPYASNLAAGHAVVLAFPKGAAPAQALPAQLATYNSRFYRVNNLQVQQVVLGDTMDLVVVQSLPGAKVAQSYALKLRGPQSPLAKLRGAGYQTLIIGIDNLPLLLQSKDVKEYQRFYEKTYK
ncbi:type IX secretion system periplasmic lipoprotein PorW/SprE [Hymenobacter chitinivorans]|uniref:Tetratricopeptide repeat protein n=1 Tax=Hymenobacter chitinivorans DSM 11115 TaxID=1121954 RepID=A0A2M9ASF4_9BACT|nr:tetratricopeptide repeat protein [Hymenobacter chitinivorans]PJJ48634.1 tetratricopeptide repeat protein [Hymenobacter chitinivorans DSM 11115]